MKIPRAICPVCKGEWATRKDGSVRAHPAQCDDRTKWCAGSYPAVRDADDVAARELWAALVLAWNDCAPDLVATVMRKWKPKYGTDDASAALAHIDGHEPDNPQGVWCCQAHRDEHES